MKERIMAIISLNLAFPLLFGFCGYAQSSSAAGSGEISPSIVYVDIFGDKEKFSEDHWIRRDITGGISDYTYINENKRGDSIVAEGRGLAGNDDYLFNFDLKREGVGNLIFEFKQFNKYYDGTGGFFSRFTPTKSVPDLKFETDRDLALKIGNLKVEGTFSKDEATKATFLYEREYRKGAKSLISWSPVTGNGFTENILPTFLETDEIVDRLSMRIEHSVNGIDVSAEQTWEKVKIESEKVNNRTLTLSSGLISNIRQKSETLDSDLYTTVVRASKQLNEKIFVSLALLYDHFRGHTRETVTDTSISSYNENNPDNPANVVQDTITVLPKVSVELLEHLNMDAGLRWEWDNKSGAANYNRDKTNPPDGILDELLNIKDEQNENKLGESFNFRFDGIRGVVFYAGGEFEQQLRNDNNTQDSFGRSPTKTNNFRRNTDIASYDYEGTLGSKLYPMPKVDVTAEFKYKYGLRNYNLEEKHIEEGDITNGYRGFLDSLSFTSLKPLVTFNFKPFRWLACNFRYAYDTTVYGVKTRVADATELSKYKSNIYSAGATFMPHDYLFFTFYYQYQQASTETPANSNPNSSMVNQPIYNANVKTLSASCCYSPVKDATIRGSYSFSQADNFNNFSSIGLPLGLDNFSQDASIELEKRITRDIFLQFRYELAQYEESSNNHYDDYIAHLFYTALKAKF